MSIGQRLKDLLAYVALIAAAAVMLFPLIYAVGVSLMTPAEVSSWPPAFWPEDAQWSNYSRVMEQLPIARFIANSFLVSLGVTLAQIVTAALSAYAFAFLNFRWKAAAFALFMSTMMVPWEVTLIPNFLLIRGLGLKNTYGAMIFPFMATAFSTFLLRQFFMQIPRDMEEAARIDGCSRFRFLWSIVLPLSRSGLITLGAYTFLSTWNSYLWPLLVTDTPGMRTVQIAVRFLMNDESRQYELIMAGVIMFLIPAALMLLWGQRYLVRGLMAGAVKG